MSLPAVMLRSSDEQEQEATTLEVILYIHVTVHRDRLLFNP